MELNEETRFALHPHFRFQWEPAQKCHVLLYPEGMIKLSETAAAILERCTNETTLGELTDNLHRAFPDAEREMIANDVSEFVSDALRQGWLKSQDTPHG